jgi:mannosylglucosylglycerate synthase
VVPNVFDFDRSPWEKDAYSSDFREAIGVDANDILFLQATRVLDRKGIELAIDTVGYVNQPEVRQKLMNRPLYDGRPFRDDSRAVLVCVGYVETIGISGDYRRNLEKRAERTGVRMIWASDRVGHQRASVNGVKKYSLWDCYTAADFVTYPSLWEGWGNQLIEAIFAQLPVVLFEYPVYREDLSRAGFELVSLGSEMNGKDDDGLVTLNESAFDRVIPRIVDLLQNLSARQDVVKRNFEIAKKHYSYAALDAIIERILKENEIEPVR